MFLSHNNSFLDDSTKHTTLLVSSKSFFGFWVCLKLLLKWVYRGDCNIFFIPQNNMFLTKVHDSAQNRFFLQLYEFDKKGLVCLLQSSSIKSYIINVLYNPRLSICTDKSTMNCEVDFDKELFIESYKDVSSKGYLCDLTKVIHIVEQLVHSPLTQNQVVVLQRVTALFLRYTAFVLTTLKLTQVFL